MFKHYRFKRTQFFPKKGVYPSYATMMEHMCSGPCLALLVTSSAASKFDEFDVVERFRALSGPLEPDVARRYEPRTTSPQSSSNHHPRMRHNIISYQVRQFVCPCMIQTAGWGGTYFTDIKQNIIFYITIYCLLAYRIVFFLCITEV